MDALPGPNTRSSSRPKSTSGARPSRLPDSTRTDVLLVDSITEAVGCAEGRFVVSGSHGGLSSGRFALQAPALLVVFNDAGVGKDGAGIAGLGLLEEAGRAACAVSHASARIGVAASSLADGVISHANAQARALGMWPGEPLSAALDRISPAPV